MPFRLTKRMISVVDIAKHKRSLTEGSVTNPLFFTYDSQGDLRVHQKQCFGPL